MAFLRALTDDSLAEQLAKLLNEHNQLLNCKSSTKLTNSKTDYIVETHGQYLIGACGREKQSYTFTEIKHLVVSSQWRGKGLGRFLVCRALNIVTTPLIYATIREDNPASLKLFHSLGFITSGAYTRHKVKVRLLIKENHRWAPTPVFTSDSDINKILMNCLSDEFVRSSALME